MPSCPISSALPPPPTQPYLALPFPCTGGRLPSSDCARSPHLFTALVIAASTRAFPPPLGCGMYLTSPISFPIRKNCQSSLSVTTHLHPQQTSPRPGEPLPPRCCATLVSSIASHPAQREGLALPVLFPALAPRLAGRVATGGSTTAQARCTVTGSAHTLTALVSRAGLSRLWCGLGCPEHLWPVKRSKPCGPLGQGHGPESDRCAVYFFSNFDFCFNIPENHSNFQNL
jgi:hypothetical protein